MPVTEQIEESPPRSSLAPSHRAGSEKIPTYADLYAKQSMPLSPTAPAFRMDDVALVKHVKERAGSPGLRGKRLLRCLAVVPKCNVLPIPGGQVLTRGICEFTAFEDEVDLLRKTLVADEEELHRQGLAQEEFLRVAAKRIKKHLVDSEAAGGAQRWEPVPVSTIVAMIKADDADPSFQKGMTYVSETSPKSMEGT